MIGLIILSGGVCVFCLIMLALYSYGARNDIVRRRVTGVLTTRKKISVIEEELDKPISERFFKPLVKSISNKLNRNSNNAQNSETKRKSQERLKKMLRQAGLSIGVSEYEVLRLLVIVGAAILLTVIFLLLGLGGRALLGTLLGIYGGYAFMRFNLTSRITNRRNLMERQLPDVLDLLSINVEAGLGFEQAVMCVIDHFDGPIIDELAIAYREMTMGRTRRDALNLFAQRCDLDDVRTFVGSIIQAEQLGISMKNVLCTQAAAIRTSRRNKIEEKAMKVPVKILFPMVFLIFPVLMIVLMGPAAVKIATQFGLF